MIKKILKFISLIVMIVTIINILFQINIFSTSNDDKSLLQLITIFSIICINIISYCYRIIIKK